MADYKWFHDYDIAMLEHQYIEDNDVLDGDGEFLRWYLAGVHDFAKKLIEVVRKGDEE